ncbi:helix-turn-helix transcriptional regulator [Tsukamurella soli]|uniref:Helix-turn-helix domain-containing protein n=1 Tax=Tsukamurella soli TaxID=644556 RepID=A0ABP8JT29_9ACTN
MTTVETTLWLTRAQLAERWQLPVQTLAVWATKGTGPKYSRMGRHVRYRLSDVEAWELAQESASRRGGAA